MSEKRENRDFVVTVIGDTPAAFAAALAFAQVNLSVQLILPENSAGFWPAAPVLDNTNVFAQLAAIPTKTGIRSPEILSLKDSCGLLVFDDSDMPVLCAQPQYRGILSSPLAAEVSRLWGRGAALRAYTDRLLPPLTIGKAQDYERLLKRRLGNKIAALPLQIARHHTGFADILHTDFVAPEINHQLTMLGSLTGAAAALGAQKNNLVMPESGWLSLRESLLTALQAYKVNVLKPEPGAALAAENIRAVNNGSLIIADLQASEIIAEYVSFGSSAQNTRTNAAAEILALQAKIPTVLRAQTKVILGSKLNSLAQNNSFKGYLCDTETGFSGHLQVFAPGVFANESTAFLEIVTKQQNIAAAETQHINALCERIGVVPAESLKFQKSTCALANSEQFANLANLQKLALPDLAAENAATNLVFIGDLLTSGNSADAVEQTQNYAQTARRSLIGL